MFKTIIIIVVVIGVLVGGLLTLRNSSRTGMPDEEVMRRASARAKEQAAKDAAEADER
jgi:FtsZ-interacting cell division protein ZipA